MSNFEVAVELDALGSHVVRVVGELDLATAPVLLARGRQLVDAAPGRVLLDLSRITFIDSTGAAALLKIRRLVLEADGSFQLAKASARVERVLAMLGLDRVFGESEADSEPPNPQEV